MAVTTTYNQHDKTHIHHRAPMAIRQGLNGHDSDHWSAVYMYSVVATVHEKFPLLHQYEDHAQKSLMRQLNRPRSPHHPNLIRPMCLYVDDNRVSILKSTNRLAHKLLESEQRKVWRVWYCHLHTCGPTLRNTIFSRLAKIC